MARSPLLDRLSARRLGRSLSRRDLLRGAAAASAGVAVLPRFALAQDGATAGGLPAGSAALRTSVGDVGMDVLKAASFRFDAATIAANTPVGEVEALLAEYGVPLPLTAAVDVPLLATGDRRVLIDAGPAGSTLPGALAAVGVAPAGIDLVVVSHWHPDHLGGTVADGAPAFPSARYLFPEEELAFLESGAEGTADALETVRILQDAGVLDLYRDGDEVAPGVTAQAAFGHTPGHHAFLIDGSALHVADAAANPLVSLRRPDWAFAFDHDPEQAAATRRRLLERAADEGLLLMASHFPFPGIGYVARSGDGFVFTPST